jgi:hypothetical protein
MDNEISGQTGTHTTAMFWEYDSRLGRRWNLDPKPFVGLSEYACLGDNPIWFCDIHGDIIDPASDKDKEKVDQTFDDTFGASSETSKLLKGSYGGTNNDVMDPNSMVDGYKNFISNKDLRQAMKKDNLSKDQKAVAVGYQKAINNKKIIAITFASQHGKSNARDIINSSWNKRSFSNQFVLGDLNKLTTEQGTYYYENDVKVGTNYVALILVYTGTSEDVETVNRPSLSGTTQTNYYPKLTTSTEFRIAASLMWCSITMNGYKPSKEENDYINKVIKGEKSSDSDNVPSYFTIDE